MLKGLTHFGRYVLLMGRLLVQREKFALYWRAIIVELNSQGVGSMFIVLTTSGFVGALLTIQTAYQLVSPAIKDSVIGGVVSVSGILEMAPTMTSLVLAGKVGSNIASQIGTMRVTEQIDALDVMGVNSASFLILPKVLSAMIVFPLLIIMAAFLLHLGGMVAGDFSGAVSVEDFATGARNSFLPFHTFFMILKSITFGFIISSVASYQGYYVKGGAIEVGTAATRAVVISCIFILVSDYVLAQLLL